MDPMREIPPLEDYPGEYCYLASEWTGQGNTVILVERYH